MMLLQSFGFFSGTLPVIFGEAEPEVKVVFYPQRLCGHHVVRRDVGISPWHRFINNNLETKTRTFYIPDPDFTHCSCWTDMK
ncbi:hypothetical protein AMECASPLE_002776 [Ameca splendens]|uniref:Secreted protein n=1 Tax=Ameca splendens TaxID=208324 RepID=A0ABV0YXR4_9TELE